jgi:hypothetical protein
MSAILHNLYRLSHIIRQSASNAHIYERCLKWINKWNKPASTKSKDLSRYCVLGIGFQKAPMNKAHVPLLSPFINGLFNDSVRVQWLRNNDFEWLTNNDLEITRKQAVMDLLQVLSRRSPGRTVEKHEKPVSMVSGPRPKTRTSPKRSRSAKDLAASFCLTLFSVISTINVSS